MTKKKATKAIKTSAPSSLDVAKKAIEKKHGNIITTLGSADTTIRTLSTGILGLDLALGRGGFAEGRIIEIYGPPSGGKTTLTMRMIAQAQLAGKNCAFIDAEHAADPELFAAMGVDNDALTFVRAFTGDEHLDVAETLLKSQAIDLLVIDSVSALIPKLEADSEIGKDHMALLARLMSKALRKLTPLASKTNADVVFINQIRHDIGAWGNDEVTSGGEATNFYSSYRVRASGGDTKSSRIIDPITGNVIGHKTTLDIVKNKLAAPYKKAEIDLIYGVGYDLCGEVLTMAVDLGLIDKAGSWYKYNGNNIGQGEFQTKDALNSNEDLYNEIRNKIIEITGLKDEYEKQASYRRS